MDHVKTAFALGALLLWSVGLAAQTQPRAGAAGTGRCRPPRRGGAPAWSRSGETSDTRTYFNRPIVVLGRESWDARRSNA